MKPEGCKEVGRKPHTLSTAYVDTPLFFPFLLNASALLLSCFWCSNVSSWPYLSLWTLRNSTQLPTDFPLLALTDRPHSCAAERRCLAHQEWVEAVVRLWQANRMRKSKLLLRRHSYCFALGTAQTDTVCNNTRASSGSPTDTTVEMDPTGSYSVLDFTQALRCIDEDLSSTLPGAGDAFSVQWRGEERALVATFPKPQNSEIILKISLSSFEKVFLASYTESPTSECVCLFLPRQLVAWVTGALPSLRRAIGQTT